MASIVQGASTCRLCGGVLIPSDAPSVGPQSTPDRPIEALPFVVYDRQDELFSFGDSVCHTDCLDASKIALRARTMRRLHVRGPSEVCPVCHGLADANCLSTFMVTSDSGSALFSANYQRVHQKCFRAWALGNELIRRCNEDRWTGPVLVEGDLGVQWDSSRVPHPYAFRDRVIPGFRRR